MHTHLIKISSDAPEPSHVKKAAHILQNGGIVAIPTETVYGLAVNAKNQLAIDKLYKIKKRPEGKPFTIQISDLRQLRNYVRDISPVLKKILDRFWPGPLTVIISTDKGKIGLRIPDNRAALSIIDEAKIPLAVTSANLSGEGAVSSAEEVVRIFDGLIDLVIDDGRIAQGIESTVLDCTVSPFKILRKGAIAKELEEFIRDNA
ncbi:MAG: L-threonylcarbamoyladenylate synthase [Candidatus Omnitrophota bacterium]